MVASALAVYALQPTLPVRGLDFYLPTLTLALAVLGWVLTTRREDRSWRENWPAAAILLAVATVSANAETKLATVDMKKLFNSYYKTKLAQASLDNRKLELRKEIKDMAESLEKAQGQYKQLLDQSNDPALSADEREKRKQAAADKVDLDTAKFTLELFDSLVLKNKEYVDLILGDIYTHHTYYMGTVDTNNKVNFYDGDLRVVGPDGKETARFKPAQYLDYIAPTQMVFPQI